LESILGLLENLKIRALAAGYDNLIGRKRPAKMHAGGINVSESIPGLFRIYKYGLWIAKGRGKYFKHDDA
jgi:hypothetical protein